MSQDNIIEAQERLSVGTGFARSVRREGMIPGIIYGGQLSSQMILLNLKTIMLETQKSNFFSKLYTLKIGDNTQKVIAKDLQVHSVTDIPLHIDFLRIDKDSKVNVFVPIRFINEDKSPAIKRGATLNVIIHNLEIYCFADMIPEIIDIDLSGLEMHQSITVDRIELPKGAKIANKERDNVLASIVASSSGNEKASTETSA
jgi:large subunit ribosomal protein L25